MFFEPEIETAGRDRIEALQLKRLRETVRRVYEHVPMYRGRLDEAGIGPDGIRSLDDLRRIPFTVRDDLRQNYPFGMFATCATWCGSASSGTTSKPRWWIHEEDLSTWSTQQARLITATGVGPDDIAQVAFGHGLLRARSAFIMRWKR